MQKGKYIFGAVFAAIFLLFSAVGALAIHYNVSQYIHVKGGTEHKVRLYNPTREVMFALLISYEPDETFQQCLGVVLTPHGSDDLDPCTVSGGCSVEIISVPTRAAIAGALNHGYGLRAKPDKGRTNDHLLDPVLFGFEDDDVRDCACDELDNAELSSRLLERFGIRCP